jgi:hypothetical protein
MANSAITSEVNNILNPFLFQVIGSTPSSILESIKKTALKDNSTLGVHLATTCIFASAVNKVVLENFLQDPRMVSARTAISTSFAISGKTNMTSITLLGHCLLTSNFLDSVKFVQEFRRKMGQKDLWESDFSKGSLSDKRKSILTEKKRVTNEVEAKLLGSGYFKYIGADKTPWTTEESTFWDLQESSSPKGKGPEAFFAAPGSSRSADSNTTVALKLSDGRDVTISKAAWDFAMSRNKNDAMAVIAKIEAHKKGVADWDVVYSDIAMNGTKSKYITALSTTG